MQNISILMGSSQKGYKVTCLRFQRAQAGLPSAVQGGTGYRLPRGNFERAGMFLGPLAIA